MFKPGLANFINAKPLTSNTRVGVVTNNTGRNSNGNHLIELLLDKPDFCDLRKIFSPEHGFSSQEPDGEDVANSLYSNKIPIISLYGKSKIPNKSDLKDVDALIYDIQDVGVRFYTYVSTLRNILDSANLTGIPVHILDRPDYAGGKIVEGPMLNSSLSSFVGHIPVPVRYGMTPGELALWWKAEANLKVDLKIWKCINYQCPTPFEQLNFPWVKPSPSMKSIETVKFYSGTCLFEGLNVSEGRGTLAPFQILGAPWIDGNLWLEAFSKTHNDEINCEVVEFSPTFSKFAGENCKGLKLTTKQNFLDNSFQIALDLIRTLMKTHPGKIEFISRPNLKMPFLDYLIGNSEIRNALETDNNPNHLAKELLEPTNGFKNSRNKVLLYERL